MRLTLLVLAALVLATPPVLSQVPDDRLIVSGQRVGKWTLDMTLDELIRMNGQPEEITRFHALDLNPDLIAFNWLSRLGLAAATKDRKNVLFLTIFQTLQFETEQPSLTYDALGLSVVIARNGSVNIIYVFRPGTASSVWKS